MLAKFVLWLIRILPILSADYRARRITPRQMCPACGCAKKHAMTFDPKQSLLVLQCVQCQAHWGYKPIVNTHRWVKPDGEVSA